MKNKKKKFNVYFSQLANEVGFSVLDIGARTEKTASNPGISGDFNLIAKGCDYVGYEPDKEELKKLMGKSNYHWKSQTFLSDALGEKEGKFDLNLYAQPGFSSKLKAKKEQFSLFSRAYYLGEDNRQIPVSVSSLDDSLANNSILNPAFVKIDIQGMELEVFKGAQSFLKNKCLGIRVEVYFHEIYENQPLFHEIDAYLRKLDFSPFQFAELHNWRRDSIKKFPFYDKKAKINFSKGQLMHADVIYLKDPSSLNKDDHENQQTRLALTALCYQHYDLAHELFNTLAMNNSKHIESVLYCQRLSKIDSKAHAIDRYSYWLKKGFERFK